MACQGKEQKGAEHVERTMGKVQHTQDAKDQRQARGDQVDRHGDGHAVQKWDEEVGHLCASLYPPYLILLLGLLTYFFDLLLGMEDLRAFGADNIFHALEWVVGVRIGK